MKICNIINELTETIQTYNYKIDTYHVYLDNQLTCEIRFEKDDTDEIFISIQYNLEDKYTYVECSSNKLTCSGELYLEMSDNHSIDNDEIHFFDYIIEDNQNKFIKFFEKCFLKNDLEDI